MRKNTPYSFFKRAFDLFFSLFFVLLLSPILLFIALLIKSSSSGKTIYLSRRIGRNHRPFSCLKFRTMYQKAEENLSLMMLKNRKIEIEWTQFQKLQNDPRITPVGRFLRKYSLDELPQLINVIKGEMSLVGPRPLSQSEVDLYLQEKGEKILSLRPGMTGLWQTSGRNLVPMNKRILLEEQYVDSCSFTQDLILLCKTIPAIIKAKGAF